MAKQPSKGAKPPATVQKPADQPGEATESDQVTKPLVDAVPPEVLKNDAAPRSADAPVAPQVAPETPQVQAAEPAPSPAAAATNAPQSRPSAGFLPFVFGGLLAGAIGFAIASFAPRAPVDTALSDRVAAQAGQIERLQAGQTQALGALESVTAELAQVTTLLEAADERLTALENQPRGGAVADGAGIAAYEAELDALRAQLTDMSGLAATQLDAARAEAAAIEANAAAAARNAAARAALARLQTGMESGAPLGAALADLEAALEGPAPAALLAVQEGVPTLAALQDRFPDAARAALATARREGVSGEEVSGLGAFLRNQFDVRSVTPQDGTSADAVLSRADAALRAGRLADALAEISALPEVARADMSDWLAQAEARADAIAAVDILSTSLSEN